MRVAFIDQSGDVVGGAERSLAILLGALPSDIQPHAVLFGDGAYAASLRATGIPVTIVSMPRAFMRTTREDPIAGVAAAPLAVAAVARHLRALDVDLVYTNTIKAHVAALPAATLVGKRCVAHLRDILHGPGRAVVRTVITGCSRERIAISNAVGVAFGLEATHVIPNPLELESYATLPTREAARSSFGIPSHVRLVSLIGRINRWKRHERLLRVAKILDRPDVHFAIVGAPHFRDADFVEELHAFVEREHLTERIHFIPWLDDVRAAYAASDINVNCSDDEPFGRTIIEAAACGVPSVAFASGGTCDALLDGETGRLVPPGDDAGFAAAVAEFIDNPVRLQHAGAAARAFARTFDAPTHALRVATVLRRVVEEPAMLSSIAPGVSSGRPKRRTGSPSIERVIVVTDHAHVTGGSGKVALTSAIALHRRGIRTSVFAATGPIAPELLAERGLEVHCTNQPDILGDRNRLAAAGRGLWNTASRAAMTKLLDGADPSRTIVHVHSWTKSLSASVLAAAINAEIPVVATLHDYFMACPLGSFFDHQRREICTVRPMGAACLTRNCDPRSGAHKAWRVGRHAVQQRFGKVPSGIRHFITISELSEGVLRPYLPPDSILHFVTNPVDVARSGPVEPARSREYTFVGRLSKEKGVVMFARAAERLGIQAVFIGDGECAADIRTACPSAQITGWLDPQRAVERMRVARVIVLPSLWYENAPLVVPEGAAMGLASIVPDTSAARDQIIDGVTGLTFRGCSEDDLVAKLVRLADDAFVARLGAEAYASYWLRPQSMDAHVDGLLDVYDRVLNGAPVPLRQPSMRFEHAGALP